MFESVTIIGRLGRDPEMRYLPSGDPVTSFSLAVDRAYTDKSGEKVKETKWFRVSVFGKQAESSNMYLKKGKLALVEGTFTVDKTTHEPRMWTHTDGTVHASLELRANLVRFLSPKGEGDAGGTDDDTDGEGV